MEMVKSERPEGRVPDCLVHDNVVSRCVSFSAYRSFRTRYGRGLQRFAGRPATFLPIHQPVSEHQTK